MGFDDLGILDLEVTTTVQSGSEDLCLTRRRSAASSICAFLLFLLRKP